MTHYTCDRCGAPTPASGATLGESVVVMDYNHDEYFETKRAELYVKAGIRSLGKEDDPDLCVACRVEIIALMLSHALRSARQVNAPTLNPKTVQDLVLALLAYEQGLTVLRDTEEHGASGIEAVHYIAAYQSNPAFVFIGAIDDEDETEDGDGHAKHDDAKVGQ